MPEICFLIGGRRILFRSDRAATAFQAMCDALEAMSVSIEDGADAELSIMPREWNEPSPIRLPDDATMIRMGGRKVFEHGDDYYIDFHENAFFRIEGRRASGVCYAHDSLDPSFWTDLCLNHLLVLLLRRLGLYFLHAGGAVAPNGVTCVFVGSGGSGKSTASIRLAEAGWPWLGDDGIFHDVAGRFHAFPRRAAATEWTVRQLKLSDRVIGARRTGKHLLRPWPVAAPSDRVRFFYPLPATAPANLIESLDEELRDLIITSQSALCETDQLIGGASPDVTSIFSNLVGIRIGDLTGLPDFLEKTLADPAGYA